MGARSVDEIVAAMASLLEPHVHDASLPWFWAWELDERVVMSVNPHNVRNMRSVLSDQFRHDLATRLGGASVVRTNSVGIFYQVGTRVERLAHRLESQALDMSAQARSMDVPIGMTRKGPLWISLVDADSVLVGGTRGFGKTMLLHGWIQALLHGKECELVLWDGKSGNEFGRYENEPHVLAMDDLDTGLSYLEKTIEERAEQFKEAGARGIMEYIAQLGPAGITEMLWVVLIIDEAALVPAELQGRLAQVVATGRAYGILPVLATQRTSVQEVGGLIKTNLATRICFPVPAVSDSMVVLGRSGAEKLPKTKGRLLMSWGARLVEAQAFLPALETAASDVPVGRELHLAERAAAEWGGVMSIPKLKEIGWSEWRARMMLNEWSSKGWLVAGVGNARQLAPRVLAAIPQALKEPQGPQGEKL